MTSSFVQLHVHSSYSPMAGIPSLPPCVSPPSNNRLGPCATDTNGLYGIIRFIELAREAGLRPIIGTELVHRGHRRGAARPISRWLCESVSLNFSTTLRCRFYFMRAIRTYRHGLIILSEILRRCRQSEAGQS